MKNLHEIEKQSYKDAIGNYLIQNNINSTDLIYTMIKSYIALSLFIIKSGGKEGFIKYLQDLTQEEVKMISRSGNVTVQIQAHSKTLYDSYCKSL